MIPKDAMAEATEKLAAAGIEAPREEAQKLWTAAFPRRYQDYDEATDGTAMARFQAMVARRALREPMAHITGGRFFWNHRFAVTPDVLDPRPDTETLVELALSEPFDRVLDLGTGSGCIVISLLAERMKVTGMGTDISKNALSVAAQNAREAEVDHALELKVSNWFEAVTCQFDLIVSNPPYISAEDMAQLQPEVRNFEPHIALTDNADGLTAYRVIAADAPHHLAPGGRLLVEIGFDQAEQVMALFKKAGLEDITCHTDLNGKDRVIAARAKK